MQGVGISIRPQTWALFFFFLIFFFFLRVNILHVFWGREGERERREVALGYFMQFHGDVLCGKRVKEWRKRVYFPRILWCSSPFLFFFFLILIIERFDESCGRAPFMLKFCIVNYIYEHSC